MESLKYVGLDVHRDTNSAAVLDEGGKLVMQSILATHAAALLGFTPCALFFRSRVPNKLPLCVYATPL
jgi:hypothetical protein